VRRGRVLAAGAVAAGGLVVVAGIPSPSWARAASQAIVTVAGGGGSTALPAGQGGTTLSLGSPVSAATDPNGNVLIADPGNNVIEAVAGKTGSFYGQAMQAGHIYTVVGDGSPGYSGDAIAQPLTQDELSAPNGVAIDPAGDVVITDTGNNAVRFIPASSGTFFGQIMTAGQIFTIAGGGSPGQIADGGQATSAGMNAPDGVAFDPAGDVVVADTNNDVVRLIPRSIHPAFGRPVLTDRIYTLAGDTTFGFAGNGGPGRNAELGLQPFAGVAVDPSGNVAVADGGNSVIWLVSASTGVIRTIVGNGNPGFTGDKRPAASATIDGPQGVAYDAAGDLFVSDSNNNMIRLVPASSGSYDGKKVKAGDIYGVVGSGTAGYSGDGGPPGASQLNAPAGVAVTATGHLVIADNGNDVVRETVPPVPRVAAVHPSSGPTSGGNRVTIKGSDLSGATAVYFGSRPTANILRNSARKVVVVAPPGAPGPVVITVVTPAGTSVAGPGDLYAYSAAAVPHHRR